MWLNFINQLLILSLWNREINTQVLINGKDLHYDFCSTYSNHSIDIVCPYLDYKTNTRENLDTKYKAITKELVIVYNDYYDTKQREQIFHSILNICDDKLNLSPQHAFLKWSIIPRSPNNPFASKYPSDFDTILLNGTISEISLHQGLVDNTIACFLKCSGNSENQSDWTVKRIFENFRQNNRQLKSTATTKLDDNFWFNDKKGIKVSSSSTWSKNTLSNKLFWWGNPFSHRSKNRDSHQNYIKNTLNYNLKRRNKNDHSKANTEQKISDLLGANILWSLGFTGKGVRVGIFDTGITNERMHHFSQDNIKEVTDWTYEQEFTVVGDSASNNFPNNLLITNFPINDTDSYVKLNEKSRRHSNLYNRDYKINRNVAGIDTLGHGTFVASVIGGSSKECPGIAPDSEIYVFRVFTDTQISYTSWYLDAFNYAIIKKIHVLNLSIGGPDFLDHPFLDKVREMSANGMIMVSSIGNDGPIAGSLNNPADMIEVIGVGAMTTKSLTSTPSSSPFLFNFGNANELSKHVKDAAVLLNDKLASFSSRGMTTWELPYGYGRVKPDIVTHGIVYGADLNGGCKVLSGTSVASPVVTGAVALLLGALIQEQSKYPESNKPDKTNIAYIKQILMAGATRLPGISIFDQGFGRMDLLKSFQLLNSYTDYYNNQTLPFNNAHHHHSYKNNNITPLNDANINVVEGSYTNLVPTLSPSYLDAAGTSDCPYIWPYCSQPLFLTSQPILVNITLLNPIALISTLHEKPSWHPYLRENGKFLDIRIANMSPVFWPYSGWIAVEIGTHPKFLSPFWEGISAGQINFTFRSYDPQSSQIYYHNLTFPIRVKIVRKPPREKRILWDQFHNLNYPPGYCPRDNLLHKEEPMDWNGDHLHTNFRALYNRLRKLGYFIEILRGPFTCFDANNYGALMIVDPEEEYWLEEITKIKSDVEGKGLSLIIFADWYNTSLMNQIKFYDENTRHWWVPDTGGSNVPALNDLLTHNWNISLGDTVLDGSFSIGKHNLNYASGTHIINFPPNNSFIYSPFLKDQGNLLLTENKDETSPKRHSKQNLKIINLPVLGLHQTTCKTLFNKSCSFNDSHGGTNISVKSIPQNSSNYGRIVIYGDSNCLDSLRMTKDCFSLVEDLLKFAMSGKLSPDLEKTHDNSKWLPYFANSNFSVIKNSCYLPDRLKGNKLYRYSKVLNNNYFLNEHYPDIKYGQGGSQDGEADVGESSSIKHPDKNLHNTPPSSIQDEKSPGLTQSPAQEVSITIKTLEDKPLCVNNPKGIANKLKFKSKQLYRKPIPSCRNLFDSKLGFYPSIQGRPLDYKFIYHLARLKYGFASFLTPIHQMNYSFILHKSNSSNSTSNHIPDLEASNQDSHIVLGANKIIFDEIKYIIGQQMTNNERMGPNNKFTFSNSPLGLGDPLNTNETGPTAATYSDDHVDMLPINDAPFSSFWNELMKAYFYNPVNSDSHLNSQIHRMPSPTSTIFAAMTMFILKCLRFTLITLCVYTVITIIWTKLPRLITGLRNINYIEHLRSASDLLMIKLCPTTTLRINYLHYFNRRNIYGKQVFSEKQSLPDSSLKEYKQTPILTSNTSQPKCNITYSLKKSKRKK